MLVWPVVSTLGHFCGCCVGCHVRCFGGLECSNESTYFCFQRHFRGAVSRRQESFYCYNDSAAVSSGSGGTRAKRAISNKTPGQKSDVEKRLKAVEERWVNDNQVKRSLILALDIDQSVFVENSLEIGMILIVWPLRGEGQCAVFALTDSKFMW